MINVALVEDNDSAAEVVDAFLTQFALEKKVKFKLIRYRDAVSFLASYTANFDLVLMDIELPDLSGMDAAYKLREIDKSVVIIFVTNMAQFAVKGYEVDALDFIVKPLSYFNFSVKLQRAVDRIRFNSDVKIKVKTDSGTINIAASRLKYVEIVKHNITYHTLEGQYNSYGALKEIEPLLSAANFIRCNSCYLVNLRYVNRVHGYIVVVDGEELLISHPRRKDFVRALNAYLGSSSNV